MKLTRSSLKILIKECIIEVLSEGIGDESTLTSISENKQPRKKASVTPPKDRKKRSSHLDSIKFDKKVNNTAEAMTNDPVMQSIFADTAKTTLQEQINHTTAVPVPGGADKATRIAAAADPTEIFEGSSNWAELAFPENIRP
tara:strand:- start:280 stop:705 length:426 start_codon:yes stop_codon:yes gene_type:complete